MFNLISEVKPAVLSILLGSVLGFSTVYVLNNVPELLVQNSTKCLIVR